MTAKPREILDFWFKDAGPKRWYAADAAFDAEIRTRFLDAWKAAKDGALDDWLESKEGALALVILVDQFPRNMFRGKGEAFSSDAKAREVAKAAIAKGYDIEVPQNARAFFYLPFMHSENPVDQDRSVELIEQRIGKDGQNYAYAIEHRDVIRRFGRFPKRNEALSRRTTAEEQAYMDAGGRF